MELLVENVRCFRGRHIAPLAPLTVLVGENSSGKSTLVSMVRVAWDALTKMEALDFNEEPFRLGAFDDIATLTAEGRSNSFSVGFRLPALDLARPRAKNLSKDQVEASVTFGGRDAQPNLAQWAVESGPYSVRHEPTSASGDGTPVLKIKIPNTTISMPIKDFPIAPSIQGVSRNWHYFRMRILAKEKERGLFGGKVEGPPPTAVSLAPLDQLMSTLGSLVRMGRPYATAPIRTRPRRTYDPLTETPTPEGDHVPMLLAKLKATDSAQWKEWLSALQKFGGSSGLFNTIDVKRMGGDEANLPFQLRVAMSDGYPFNLVDVGYGVSQVLPILVDAITNKNRMLLLQQPEVHLHPRAQAALGSFLSKLAADQHRSAPILLETHSDYLLDRIRMEVRDKHEIKAEDVVILYLGRDEQGSVSIKPIRIDENGNLIDVPPGYRSFFMEEDRRLLQG